MSPPSQRKTLWCCEADGAIVSARLTRRGPHGTEVQLTWNGRLYFAELHRTEEEAVAAARELRSALAVPRRDLTR